MIFRRAHLGAELLRAQRDPCHVLRPWFFVLGPWYGVPSPRPVVLGLVFVPRLPHPERATGRATKDQGPRTRDEAGSYPDPRKRKEELSPNRPGTGLGGKLPGRSTNASHSRRRR